MERNKYLQINLNKCKTHLSVFGKKVLHVLLEQWNNNNAREEKYEYQHYQPTNTQKILNFNAESSCHTPAATPLLPPPIQIHTTDSQLHFNDLPPDVPTTEDLTKTLQIHTNINNNEFAHPTTVSRNIVNEVLHVGTNNEEQTLNKVNSLFDNIDRNETNEVDWDNMFDSELFDDVNKETNVNNSDATFPNTMNLFSIKANNDNDNKQGTKRKYKDTDALKKIKKYREANKKLNEPPKKVSEITAHAPKKFRKQKYTKTVKNWLSDNESYNNGINDDIDTKSGSNAIIDKETTKSDVNKCDNNEKAAAKKDKLEIIIEKTLKPQSNKKVVQAQLTNKGGVMKFSKPKTEVAEPKKSTVTDGVTVKDKKEKVAKKFVPPVKSQVPLKDITYEVLTVDDSNVGECCDTLSASDNEVIVILIYSNGFNQLNSHFTDGSCAADGLLICAGDMFYCFKSAGGAVKEALTRIITNNKLITYEAQNVLIYLTTDLQMEISNLNIYDAKIGASLLDPDNPTENFSDLQKLLSFTAPYTIATECPLQKASWYITLLKECWSKLKDALVQEQLWNVFVDIEMKLLPIIAEMASRGVSVDMSKLKSMEELLLARMKLMEQACYEAAGKVFQINSALQVRAILYDELQLDTRSNVKIRETLAGGVKSTSESMLRSLVSVHPLPKLILEYRHLHKAHATFLAGIAQHVRDGVVKPTWVQTAAATGRIASNNPNLQAIPRAPFSLVMFPDAGDTEVPQVKFRSVYVARAGYSLVAADFKHVECRVFAHAAADRGLLRALMLDRDLFVELASQWLKKSPDSVTGEERARTKRLVYAALYGAGTRKLMDILDVGYEHALQAAASFNRTFPSLKSFGQQVVSACSVAGGRLATLCGRVRRVRDISSRDRARRAHAQRQAVNFVVQGSAADLCKTAMIETSRALRAQRPAVCARLVLQIHDELVWEVRAHHVHVAAGIIKRVMEACGERCGMSMKLPVAITVGDNWGEMDDYTPET